MIQIAKGISDEDTKAAAEYFASMKYPVWYKVVEGDTVPKSYLGNGAMRFPVENGGTEPLGNRIIELPQNDFSAESRDPRTGFVAHVPAGSIKKGEELVTTGGGGKTVPCAICHGPELSRSRPGSADHRPLADLHLSPAQRHQDRHPQRHLGAADEGRGGEARRRRHDCDRRLPHDEVALTVAAR